MNPGKKTAIGASAALAVFGPGVGLGRGTSRGDHRWEGDGGVLDDGPGLTTVRDYCP